MKGSGPQSNWRRYPLKGKHGLKVQHESDLSPADLFLSVCDYSAYVGSILSISIPAKVFPFVKKTMMKALSYH